MRSALFNACPAALLCRRRRPQLEVASQQEFPVLGDERGPRGPHDRYPYHDDDPRHRPWDADERSYAGGCGAGDRDTGCSRTALLRAAGRAAAAAAAACAAAGLLSPAGCCARPCWLLVAAPC